MMMEDRIVALRRVSLRSGYSISAAGISRSNLDRPLALPASTRSSEFPTVRSARDDNSEDWLYSIKLQYFTRREKRFLPPVDALTPKTR